MPLVTATLILGLIWWHGRGGRVKDEGKTGVLVCRTVGCVGQGGTTSPWHNSYVAINDPGSMEAEDYEQIFWISPTTYGMPVRKLRRSSSFSNLNMKFR